MILDLSGVYALEGGTLVSISVLYIDLLIVFYDLLSVCFFCFFWIKFIYCRVGARPYVATLHGAG